MTKLTDARPWALLGVGQRTGRYRVEEQELVLAQLGGVPLRLRRSEQTQFVDIDEQFIVLNGANLNLVYGKYHVEPTSPKTR